MDPSPSRALTKSKLLDFAPPRLVILPNLARFPENLRMTISTHRSFEAKPVQPDSFALTSYIERIEFQLIWKSWRPNLSQSFFLRCPGGQNQESHSRARAPPLPPPRARSPSPPAPALPTRQGRAKGQGKGKGSGPCREKADEEDILNFGSPPGSPAS